MSLPTDAPLRGSESGPILNQAIVAQRPRRRRPPSGGPGAGFRTGRYGAAGLRRARRTHRSGREGFPKRLDGGFPLAPPEGLESALRSLGTPVRRAPRRAPGGRHRPRTPPSRALRRGPSRRSLPRLRGFRRRRPCPPPGRARPPRAARPPRRRAARNAAARRGGPGRTPDGGQRSTANAAASARKSSRASVAVSEERNASSVRAARSRTQRGALQARRARHAPGHAGERARNRDDERPRGDRVPSEPDAASPTRAPAASPRHPPAATAASIRRARARRTARSASAIGPDTLVLVVPLLGGGATSGNSCTSVRSVRRITSVISFTPAGMRGVAARNTVSSAAPSVTLSMIVYWVEYVATTSPVRSATNTSSPGSSSANPEPTYTHLPRCIDLPVRRFQTRSSARASTFFPSISSSRNR